MSHTLIIAEAGVNHNGKLDLALKLCDAAKEAGADVVKFQTWKTEKIITRTVSQADYQTENTGKTESQFDMLKRLELSYDDFRKIKAHCDKIGIQFASTADEEESLDFLISLGIPFIKIGSGEITNIPYLRIMGSKKLPIIISSGMSTLAEVDVALAELRNAGATDIILLHCTTNYPCSMQDVNLKAILTLKEAFKIPVGYSDHTEGIEVPVAAVAMGAKVIEKHFTLDRNMEGPDHKASLEPNEFKSMVSAIRNIEKALGTGNKVASPSETENKDIARKSIVASRMIKKGEVFTKDNITTKRPGSGISPMRWYNVIGAVAKRDFQEDELIEL